MAVTAGIGGRPPPPTPDACMEGLRDHREVTGTIDGVRGRRLLLMLAVAAVTATAAAVAVHALFRTVTKAPPSCTVGSGDAALVLSPDQAEDASTIAAVAKRMQVPDHA